MNLVGNVSLEHIILGDQSLGAFGEKHLVAELDGRAHFTALDQVGMWLEDRIDLLRIGDLLAVEHTAAGLLDHPRSETAIICNLVADGVDLQGRQHVRAALGGGVVEHGPGVRHHLFGNVNQRSIGCPLRRSGPLALARRHALDLVHAPVRSARRLRKPAIRRSSSALASRPTRRVRTRTTSHNNVLSVG